MIELIMAIVIVGILAAIATPKFFDVARQANIQSVRSLEAAVRATTSNVRMLCAATPKSGCLVSNPFQVVILQGRTYWLNYGWVDAGDFINIYQIDIALSTSGVTVSTPTKRITQFSKDGASDPSRCAVSYSQALSEAGPNIVSDVTGC